MLRLPYLQLWLLAPVPVLSVMVKVKAMTGHGCGVNVGAERDGKRAACL